MRQRSRSTQIEREISRLDHCAVIVEVGTWNGNQAQRLAHAALKRNGAVRYIGFDLFEMQTEADLIGELSKKPPSRATVSDTLERFKSERTRLTLWRRRRTFEFDLIPGYTKDTLPAFVAANPGLRVDLAFIDGGHSIPTIDNDWAYVSQLLRPGGVILLDDYYGDAALAQQFGCNSLIDRLRSDPRWRTSILPHTDVVPGIGTIQLAKVEACK